jgi:hypothetical protein
VRRRDAVLQAGLRDHVAPSNAAEITVDASRTDRFAQLVRDLLQTWPVTNSAGLAAAGSILLISMCPTKLFDGGLRQKEQCPIMATTLTIP